MCHCKEVEFGTYDNVVEMKPPFVLKQMNGEVKKNQWVSIDCCIATEISLLWKAGIVTMNSCCGHNKLIPTVIVHTDSIELMKKLGYESQADMERDNGLGPTVRPDETFYLKL